MRNVKSGDLSFFAYSIFQFHFRERKARNKVRYFREGNFQQYGLENIQFPVAAIDGADLEDQLKRNINLFSFFDVQGKGRYPFYLLRKEYAHSMDLRYLD